MTTSPSSLDPSGVTGGDDNYEGFLSGFQKRLDAIPDSVPLFTTEAAGFLTLPRDPTTNKSAGQGLFLDGLPAEYRQHYACRSCSKFLETYGNLVTITPDGTTKSVFWDETVVPPFFVKAVKAMRLRVEKARVSGVFHSAEKSWGIVSNKGPTRTWNHMSATPSARRLRDTTQTAFQAMAALTEDHGMLSRALNDCSMDVAGKTVSLIKSGALYRADKIEAAAQWFFSMHIVREAAKNKENATWLCVASAPTGFCHVRSNVIGSLLEDVKNGLDVKAIAARFAERMDPLTYRRPTAAPSAGQVDAAEKVVEALGVVPAFARRYANLADFRTPDAVLWTHAEVSARPASESLKKTGVFDHLKAKTPEGATLDIPPRLMTWEKFARDILPGVAALAYRVPLVGPFCALTTAADPEAPPILQWDSLEKRNPVSWSFPHPAARADEWNLQPGSLVGAPMIVRLPNAWNDSGTRFQSHGDGIFLPLVGARDTRKLPGGGFFPEHLRSELMPYRATIEAHVNKLVVTGADDPIASGFGIGFLAGTKWTEMAAPKVMTPAAGAPAATAPKTVNVTLVVDNSGSMQSYLGAARTALASLLVAIRGMPGSVNVTFALFGDRTSFLTNCAPLSSLEGIERHMNAGSGGTALNDAIVESINCALRPYREDEVNFLGIVTDGEENQSRRPISEAFEAVRRAQVTGRWTIAYAGAGHNPKNYARSIGIPEGNMTAFEASAHGFDDIGRRYSTSTQALSFAYASGQKASTSFFGAAGQRQEIGKDTPVFVATMKDGSQAAFTFDRWE